MRAYYVLVKVIFNTNEVATNEWGSLSFLFIVHGLIPQLTLQQMNGAVKLAPDLDNGSTNRIIYETIWS